jgi:putative acetyltransferase
MHAMLIIREEQPDDYPAVYELNGLAFKTDAEARLVNALRRKVRPLVSLVAERDERLVGHIMFTPVALDDAAVGARTMGLAPLAVHPDAQRQGIGARLVHAGFDACKVLRTELIFVLGLPGYYARFGFHEASTKGFHYKDETLDPNFFVLELTRGAASGVSGTISYHPLFDTL